MTIDTAFNAMMVSIENPALTGFSKFIAVITEPIVLLIASLIISIVLYFKYSKRKAKFFAITIITATIILRVLKETFARARPLNSLIAETGFSLPSGHATISTVFFGALVYLFAKKKKSAIITATTLVLLIGFTRLYLRVHWVTDILTGLVLGSLILYFAIRLDRK